MSRYDKCSPRTRYDLGVTFGDLGSELSIHDSKIGHYHCVKNVIMIALDAGLLIKQLFRRKSNLPRLDGIQVWRISRSE